ncbi:MAG: hypothetical protein JWO57_1781 [Pseudonocardiales bacterium]|nr:hypothetical protein [Pseudonocardiales bacterium]
MIAVPLVLALADGAMWMALRVLGLADPADIPSCCRKRIQWWRANANLFYASTAAICLVAVALQISRLAG